MGSLLSMLKEVGAEDGDERDGKIPKNVAEIGSGHQTHEDPGGIDEGHAHDLLSHDLLKV